MIFDCAYVTTLLEVWKKTDDPKVLELILEHTKNLVEAIVSSYDPSYREDLIQESFVKVHYALPYFDGNIANLHTYLTTVIKNICLTYLRKQNKLSAEYQIDFVLYPECLISDEEVESNGILQDLIIRNRTRFPSIDVTIIDELTIRLYSDLTFNASKNMIISNLIETSACTRQVANIVYNSSLIYLRSKYLSFAVLKKERIDEELSILPDLQELVGDKAGALICNVLTGMIARFP